jgi:hypothetical protein
MPDKIQYDKAVARAAYITDEFHDAVISQVVDHAHGQGYIASRQRIAHSICPNDPNGEAESAGHPQFHSDCFNSQLPLNFKQQLAAAAADIENLA